MGLESCVAPTARTYLQGAGKEGAKSQQASSKIDSEGTDGEDAGHDGFVTVYEHERSDGSWAPESPLETTTVMPASPSCISHESQYGQSRNRCSRGHRCPASAPA